MFMEKSILVYLGGLKVVFILVFIFIFTITFYIEIFIFFKDFITWAIRIISWKIYEILSDEVFYYYVVVILMRCRCRLLRISICIFCVLGELLGRILIWLRYPMFVRLVSLRYQFFSSILRHCAIVCFFYSWEVIFIFKKF